MNVIIAWASEQRVAAPRASTRIDLGERHPTRYVMVAKAVVWERGDHVSARAMTHADHTLADLSDECGERFACAAVLVTDAEFDAVRAWMETAKSITEPPPGALRAAVRYWAARYKGHVTPLAP